ncbi:MAG: hypothetical protein J6B06_00255 [Lachnospiraceae bacterium]|nr:hypothetical protein [Lachnospiraceae bacterium]
MTTEQGLLIFGCAVFLFLIVQFSRNQKKNKEKFLCKAREGFGKVPEREYDVQELERISHYFKNYCAGAEFYLDDLTWNDIGMEDVFLLMNQTYSSIGEDYLYWLLRTPVTDEKVLRERHRLICYFQTHEEERLKLQHVYHQLGRMRAHSVTDYFKRLMELPQESNIRHYAVILAELLSVALLFINGTLGGLCLAASIVYGIADYYKRKGIAEPYFVCFRQITGMLYYTDELTKTGIAELSTYWKELKEIKKECQGLLKGSRLITARQAAGSLGEVVLDYVRILTHVDLIQFNKMLWLAKSKKKEIRRMMEIFGFLESMIAAASFRELLGEYCIPEFEAAADRPSFVIKGMYHPQIDEPVPNDISVPCAGQGARQSGVLITGSNASGKSTFLKTVGICSVLAQTIMTVPAERYRANFFKLYSSMAVKDDLNLKESYYLAEIKALRRILIAGEQERQQGGYVLCLVDEVLRGTNTVERIAASAQVLKGLSGGNILCFAATHDIELTYMLEQLYANYHFEEEICDGDIRFDYQLRTGRAVTRNAIRLLSLLGYPEEMTEAAETAAREFMEKGEWKCL